MSPSDDLSNEQIAKTCWINMVEEEDQDGIQKVTLQPIIAALDAKDTLLSKLTAERDGLQLVMEGFKVLCGKGGPQEPIDILKAVESVITASQERVRELGAKLKDSQDGKVKAIAAIQAERDAAQKELRLIKEAPMGPICNLCRHEGIEDKLDAALMALEKYGRHTNMCGMEEKGHPCICGLDKALANLKKGATS